MYKDRKTAVIICAGGIGKRMGAGIPKQFIELADGTSILRKSVDVFRLPAVSALVDDVIVACPEGFDDETERLANGRTDGIKADVVTGGAERQDSVRNALTHLKEKCSYKDGDIVLIHDGARPFVTEETVLGVLDSAYENSAAIAAVPVKDTIRDADLGTADRSRLYSVQTPQGFRFGLIMKAVENACRDGFYGTDDGSLAEREGVMPDIVPGTYSNVKITTPEDLHVSVNKRSEEEEDQMAGQSVRIGHGFDVHQLAEGRKLILGGIEIPYELGLLGHSDADVLTHALMDAMLGACALGDIGHLFPDTDDTYLGADSMKLLSEVTRITAEAGYSLVNCDVTVICQKPKLAPYIGQMRERLAEVTGVDKDQVSVKATTTEKLGFTGRGEGIAAEAVCLMKKE